MDGLEVDSELLVTISDDEDADKTRSVTVGTPDLVAETTLVDDLETRLEVAGLGHSDETAALGNIDDAILLVDRAHHGVLDDGGRRVRDNAGFLVELTGEEIDTEITMLARGGRGSDADQLAGALLENDNITDADVVAGNGIGATVLGGARDGNVTSTATAAGRLSG